MMTPAQPLPPSVIWRDWPEDVPAHFYASRDGRIATLADVQDAVARRMAVTLAQPLVTGRPR